jgi:1,4-dihydroxy-6-naphthoate synthase
MYVMNDYILLKSGSALGFNCGPLLVQRADCVISNIDTVKIAIPGIYTTANFLLSLAYPNAKNKIEMVFSDIEKAVLNGDADAGLIIHESRFTYGEKGLKKIADLGEFWETLIHAPIPLGGIVARRSFDENTLQKINRCIRRSIEYAFSHPESVMDYVQLHSQEMNKAVMKKHIELYVNEFSIDLGNTGSDAINLMVNTAMKKGLIHRIPSPLMIA